MPSVSFQHINITWTSKGLEYDPLAPLMDFLPPSQPSLTSKLEIELFPAKNSHPHPKTYGGTSLFFHGPVKALSHNKQIVLWDGASLLTLKNRGRLITGSIHPDSLLNRKYFSMVTLFIVLVVALRYYGLFNIHSGAVALGDQGVLILGDANSGKSTCTLSLMTGKNGWLSDDALFLNKEENKLKLWAFPKPFHIRQNSLRAFPQLHPFIEYSKDEYAQNSLDPREIWPNQRREWMGGTPILLFPEINRDQPTHLISISGSEAFGNLLVASTLAVIDGLPNTDEHTELLQKLSNNSLPLKAILGPDLLERPQVLEECILRFLAKDA